MRFGSESDALPPFTTYLPMGAEYIFTIALRLAHVGAPMRRARGEVELIGTNSLYELGVAETNKLWLYSDIS